MLISENGPFDVFERVRRIAGVPETGEVKGFFPSLLSCLWCLSIWIALGFWAIWEFWRPEPVMIVAAMSFAILVEEAVQWLGRKL